MSNFPSYDAAKTYQWNYDHAPAIIDAGEPRLNGNWRFAGHSTPSPLGVAAGPLLNGDWCLYYAHLGFDVVTYKTVRSSMRACYDLPNLQPVKCDQLSGGEQNLPSCMEMHGSWAVSYGMPSQDPVTWQDDIRRTRSLLNPEKKLSVSVVGSIQEDWTLDQLADDYAHCAQLAAAAGADAIETNFSCPNVSTCDGQLFQNLSDAEQVARRVREAIGTTPLLIKVGHIPNSTEVHRLVEALVPYADALVMTNSIAATVIGTDGQQLFDGQPRGICGSAIRDASVRQVEHAANYVAENNLKLEIIGVGGISTVDHVKQYLDAGASTVQLATAVMTTPDIGLRIREQW